MDHRNDSFNGAKPICRRPVATFCLACRVLFAIACLMGRIRVALSSRVESRCRLSLNDGKTNGAHSLHKKMVWGLWAASDPAVKAIGFQTGA